MSVNVRPARLDDYEHVATCFNRAGDRPHDRPRACGKVAVYVVRPLSPAFAAPEFGSCRFCLSAVVDHAQASVE